MRLSARYLCLLGGFIIVAALATIELVPSLAANFADNVLRPVIGDHATISLESVAFSLTDDMKRMMYGTVARPSANVFAPLPTKSVAITTPTAKPHCQPRHHRLHAHARS